METLTSYLEAHGLTQAAFAGRIGITQGALSKICNGRNPDLGVAIAIERETGGLVPVAAWPKYSAIVSAANGGAQ
jgi:transcriptional regulator with XRE-family HTH domain